MKKEPFRLRVLQAMSRCLEEITPDAGSEFDLSNAVFRGRVLFDDTNDPCPMISILEAPIPIEWGMKSGDITLGTGNWELLVQGFVDDDKQHPTDPAHRLMADVKARLVKEKKRERAFNILGMDRKVVDMNIGQGAVRPPDMPSSKAFFWLTVTLKLSEDLEDPYS